MKEIYDWNQTPKTITIKLPTPYKIDPKNFNIEITEYYLQFNIIDLKKHGIIYFHDKVEFESSRIKIFDRHIEFFINKETEANWPDLEPKISKDDLTQRRKIAKENYEKKVQENSQKAQERKKELEKFVVGKSMKLDEEKRNELREKKTQEKTNIENELYDFVKQYDQKEKNSVNNNHFNDSKNKLNNETDSSTEDMVKDYGDTYNKNKHLSLDQEHRDSDNNCMKYNDKTIENQEKIKNRCNLKNDIFEETDLKKAEKAVEIEECTDKKPNDSEGAVALYDRNNSNNNKNRKDQSSNEIFDEKTVEKNKYQIRNESKINVNLTEKAIPHFAARESLSKEPPYPKSKKFVVEKNHLGLEIEDRNPIWTKERADNLFKNRDFKGAIGMYNRALELDPEFHKVYLNRATAHMLLGEFDCALSDLLYLEGLINTVDKSEIEEAFYQKILAKVYIKSYAIYGIKNEFKKALEFFEKIKSCKVLLEQKILEKINKDQQMLENRMTIEAEKLAADECLKKGELREAEERYLRILDAQPENIINQNEKVLSNLSLIYLNLEEYQKCILFCNDILKIIKNFKEKFAFSKYDNTFQIKILLRRAKSFEKTCDIAKAQADIEAAEKLEIRNPEIYSDVNGIKNDLKMKILEKYKETANKLLEQGQFSDALEYYDKSISLAKFLPKIDGLKLYLNRCSCLIKLGQFENSESECSRILSVLAKQKNIAIINSNLELLEKIKQLEFLTLVKRAFVHTQQKKVFEAIQDYNAALELKPDDKKIKENLNLIKASI